MAYFRTQKGGHAVCVLLEQLCEASRGLLLTEKMRFIICLFVVVLRAAMIMQTKAISLSLLTVLKEAFSKQRYLRK